MSYITTCTVVFDIFHIVATDIWWMAYIILYHKQPSLRRHMATCDNAPVLNFDEDGETNSDTPVSRCLGLKYAFYRERDK